MMKFNNAKELEKEIHKRYKEDQKVIDVSDMDVSNLDSLSRAFYVCRNLKEIIGLENWDTSNVRDMSYMFQYCYELKTIDLSSWDFSNVEDMQDMFGECFILEKIKGIENWNTSKANIDWIFFYTPLEEKYGRHGEKLHPEMR